MRPATRAALRAVLESVFHGLADAGSKPVTSQYSRDKDASAKAEYRHWSFMDGPDKDFREVTRVSKTVFRLLADEIRLLGVCSGRSVSVEEKLVIFLTIIGNSLSQRVCHVMWGRGPTVIHQALHEVASAICKLSQKYIKGFTDDPSPYIQGRPDLAPYFKDAVGAVDGTHIPAVLPARKQAKFRSYKGGVSQNVMACCDFEGHFRYVLVGWEGTAHDSRVWRDAKSRGFRLPPGKYMLADAGYPSEVMLLTPFRGVAYHLKEFRNRRYNPESAQELFNYKHASLRSEIERSFGRLKARFRILRTMPRFSFNLQRKLVMCCFVLHNFIQAHGIPQDFTPWACDPQSEEVDDSPSEGTEEELDGGSAIREEIAHRMWQGYIPPRRRASRRRASMP